MNTESMISVIVPTYNSENYVGNTIESILKQTHTNFEVLIVDDCSTDSTQSVCKKYAQAYGNIHFFSLDRNSGSATARNLGIEKAKGRYISFLDSDDLWHPRKLEKQLNFMQKNNASISHHDYLRFNVSSKKFLSIRKSKDKVSYADLASGNTIGCCTVMYDTKKIGKVLMEPSLRTRQDLHCWMQILKKVPHSLNCKEALATYNIRENSISSNKLKAATQFWKIIRVVEKLPLARSLFYFSLYAYRNLSLRIREKLYKPISQKSLLQ
jgi:teichuronic acid biosynthesis glycosyltransferase TuaG